MFSNANGAQKHSSSGQERSGQDNLFFNGESIVIS